VRFLLWREIKRKPRPSARAGWLLKPPSPEQLAEVVAQALEE